MHAGTCVETGSNGRDEAQSSPPASNGTARSRRALQNPPEEDLFNVTTSANVSTTTDSRTVDGNPADSRDPAFAYATSVKVEYTDGRVRLTTFNVSGCNGTRTAEFFPPSGCNMTDPSFKATRLGARIVSTVDPVSHLSLIHI